MDPAKLTARLREMLRPPDRPVARRDATAPPPAKPVERDACLDRLARLFGGSGDGQILVVDRQYPGVTAHGRTTIHDYAVRAGEHRGAIVQLARLSTRRVDEGQGALDLEAEGDWQGPIVFFDLETTGLSGGAGTCAFLVGCGWFDAGTFCTRQFFLPGYPAEPALLAAVLPLIQSAAAVVTFNGRTFDVPLIEMRYLFHRMRSPFGRVAHVDLLHPARRLWKRRAVPAPAPSSVAGQAAPGFDLGVEASRGADWGASGSASCALSALEDAVLGVSRRGDVPGWEIPGRYFAYVRGGDPRPLLPVFEHNRLDLLSLAALTATVTSLVEKGANAARDPRECVALGRLYDRLGETAKAAECYRHAAENGDPITRSEALHYLAYRLRRERRYEQAAAAWCQILDLSSAAPSIESEAVEALAIYHEHRSRDLLAARRYAVRALDLGDPFRAGKARHRLARLDRKLARSLPTVSHTPAVPNP